MKLSISNIAWNKEHDSEIYVYLKTAGFNGIEIAPTRFFADDPYEHIEDMLIIANDLENKYNLQISSMQSILFGCIEQLFGSEEERLAICRYLTKAINFASAINCHNLVFGSPKNRIIKNLSDRKIAIEFFKKMGDYADSMNTILSIEANPVIYGTNFLNYTEDAIKLIKEVDSKGFMLNFDLGTLIENGEEIDEILKSIHYINHIHISEPNLSKIIKRDEHKQLFNKLKLLNYKNYVSIEMKNTNEVYDVKWVIDYLKEVRAWSEE